jgi:hypothetical protein
MKRGFHIIIGLTLMAAIISSCGGSPEAQDNTAMVIAVVSRVDAHPRPQDDWGPATAGMTIYGGGQVRTGPASYARLELLEGIVRLAAESIFTVRESTTRQDRLVTRLFLQEGRLWAHVTTDQPHDFSVETASAVAAVRDTRFSVRVALNQATLVSVAEGEAVLTAQGVSVTVVAGNQAIVDPGQPPAPPEPMSDEERGLWATEGEMPEIVSVITRTPTPTPTPTPAPAELTTSRPTLTTTPTSTPTVISTSTPEPVPPPCVEDADFVADVTVPDGTLVEPGTRIEKVWRIRNSGNCPWQSGFMWVFVGGDQMEAPAVQAVPPTAAGADVDILMTIVAPTSPGSYSGFWRMRGPTGEIFGPTYIVQIEVSSIGPGIDEFVGDWVNVDSNTRGMTRLIIEKVNDNTVSFQGFGQCQPTDCDWGIINVPFTPPTPVGTYEFDYKQSRITLQLAGDQLLAEVFDDYTQADGRTDTTSNYVLHRAPVDQTPEAEYWLAPDRSIVDASSRECVTLTWHVKYVAEAYLDGVPLQGENGTITDCPCDDRDDTPEMFTHTLRVVKSDGSGVGETVSVPVAGSCPVAEAVDDFVGNWVNVDLDTRGMTRLVIEGIDSKTVSFQGYGQCQPTDCDWGVIRVPFTPPTLVGTYEFSFKQTRITVWRSRDSLLAEVFDDYTETDGRTDRTTKYVLQRSPREF